MTIEVTEADIGRAVIYTAQDGTRERGFITSFTDRFVFVRYGNDLFGKATLRSDLEFEAAENGEITNGNRTR